MPNSFTFSLYPTNIPFLGIFVRYNENVKGFLVYFPEKRKISLHRDVIFRKDPRINEKAIELEDLFLGFGYGNRTLFNVFFLNDNMMLLSGYFLLWFLRKTNLSRNSFYSSSSIIRDDSRNLLIQLQVSYANHV